MFLFTHYFRIFLISALFLYGTPVFSYDGLVEKKVFESNNFITTGGATIKKLRVGWESYGKLNAAKDNVILIEHFFSGTSHAAGKYRSEDPTSGYWDSIIGSGKMLDTDKYFIISSDSIVNFNAKSPDVVTTGPASINPKTGRPYGLTFPIVTIRDFVNVQKALIDSLGIKSLHTVVGTSMGSLQALDWGAAYPDMVKGIVAITAGGETDPYLIGWLNIWSVPIKLDHNWNNGDYYGKVEPTVGLSESLKIAILQARHWKWADATFGRRWAKDAMDPRLKLDNQYAVESWLDQTAAKWSTLGDANHFLYLVKAWQTFVIGNGSSLAEGLASIKSPILLISSADDLVYPPEIAVKPLQIELKKKGVSVEYTDIVTESSGHFDGLGNISKADNIIRRFINK